MKPLLVAALLVAAMAASADPLPGQTVSPAALQTRDGAPYRFEPHGVTIVSFFAFWCYTWKQQSPRLSNAMKQLAGFPVSLLTVSVDGRWSNVPGYDPALPLALDRTGWSHSLGVDTVPTTVVLDSAAVVRWVKSGVVRTDELADEARKACSPLAGGPVTIRLASFPPPEGGFQILDDLRRVGAQVELELIQSRSPAQKKLLQMAISQGNILAAPGREHAIDGLDTTRPGKKELLRRLLEEARPGVTIELHADVAESRAILAELIEGLRARGLTVKPVKK